MGKVEKSPSMPLYGKDAYDDEAFRLLSFAAQGLFWRLAWWQWQEGSIPADLDAILDVLPRRHAHEVKRVWPMLQSFFPAIGNGTRRQNETTEVRRASMLGRRGRNQLGAEITNAIRRDKKTLSDTDSVTLSDTLSAPDSVTLRAASASATGSSSPILEEGSSRATVSKPDFAVAAEIEKRCDEVGFRYAPTIQIIVAWLGEYGEELILETLDDLGKALVGKHYHYFESVLTSRRDNPSERPSFRRRRSERPSTVPVGLDTTTKPVFDLDEAEPVAEPNAWSEIRDALGINNEAKLLSAGPGRWTIGVPQQEDKDEIRETFGAQIRRRLPDVRIDFVAVRQFKERKTA